MDPRHFFILKATFRNVAFSRLQNKKMSGMTNKLEIKFWKGDKKLNLPFPTFPINFYEHWSLPIST